MWSKKFEEMEFDAKALEEWGEKFGEKMELKAGHGNVQC